MPVTIVYARELIVDRVLDGHQSAVAKHLGPRSAFDRQVRLGGADGPTGQALRRRLHGERRYERNPLIPAFDVRKATRNRPGR